MKKCTRIFVFLCLGLLFSAPPVLACHIESVQMTADCDAYVITGGVKANWYYHDGFRITYDLMVNDRNISGTADYMVDRDDNFSSYEFRISGSLPDDICGEVRIKGELEMVSLSNANDVDNAVFDEIVLDCPCDICTRTPGFWKNHPSQWPVDSLMLGGTVYGQEELLYLLENPYPNDMKYKLMKHLIAAKLNVSGNAGLDYIEGVIEAADAFLAGTDTGDDPETLKDMLDAFNNGGAAFCDKAEDKDEESHHPGWKKRAR